MSFVEQSYVRARARHARLLFVEGDDERVRAAAGRLETEGLARVEMLTASKVYVDDSRLPAVAGLLRERRPDRVHDGVHALDLASDPLLFGAALVALGEVDGCVAGAVHSTADVLRAALWAIGTAPGVSVASSSFYMVMPDDQVLTFTDCAVVPNPTPPQLAEIALAAARDRAHLVGDEPRVAFLSYSTRGSASSPAVTAVQEGAARFRALAPGIVSDGELQVDAALVPVVAEQKAPGSGLAGRANILVFPDLASGNIAYKLVQRLAGAMAIGPLLQGLTHPMADLSRGASVDDIVSVAVLLSLQAPDSPTRNRE